MQMQLMPTRINNIYNFPIFTPGVQIRIIGVYWDNFVIHIYRSTNNAYTKSNSFCIGDSIDISNMRSTSEQ